MSDTAAELNVPVAPFPWPQVSLLALSHLLVDGFACMHLTLMPLLQQKLEITKAAAGALLLAMTLPGNFGQALVGHLWERRSQKLMMGVGLLTCVIAMGFAGRAGGYWPLAGILFVVGVGLALYHPGSAKLAGALAGRRRGLAVSIWSAAGSMGVWLGPALIGTLVGAYGLRATPWAIALGLPLALPVLWRLQERPAAEHRARASAGGPTRVGPFIYLTVQTGMRSMCIAIVLTRLSFYCQSDAVGMSPGMTGNVIGAFSMMGVLGVLVGGPLSDRMSRRWVMVVPIMLMPAAALIFVFWPSWVTAIALGVSGFLVWAGHPVNIVLAQELMPRNVGLASGVIIGGAWGLSTLTQPFWGWIADLHGEKTTLVVFLLTAPVLSGVMALFQPYTEGNRPATQEVDA